MKAFVATRTHGDGDGGLKEMLYPQTAPKRLVAFLGFLTLREMVDGMLRNVYYLGLSFAPQYVDGGVLAPTAYFLHDIEHAITEPLSPKFQNDLIEFLRYVNTLPASTQYSIYFILFYLLHEGGKGSSFSSKNKRSITITSHYTSIDDLWVFIYQATIYFMDGFVKMTKFGPAIPAAYRIPAKKGYLQQDKVREYVELAATRYVDAWEDFRKGI
jgi:hypothetical protein